MLHEVRDDGTVEPNAVAALSEHTPITIDVTVNGTQIPHATVTAFWFHIGLPAAPYYAGDWEVTWTSGGLPQLTEADRAVEIDIAGRPANGIYGGPGRLTAKTHFPFTYDEWKEFG